MSRSSAVDAEILRRAKRIRLFRYDADGNERSPDEQAQLGRSEFEACKASFFYWIDNYGWLHDPHASDPTLSVIPFLLWPKQRELAQFLIDGIDNGENRHVNKARSIGASWMALHIFIHRFLTKRGFTAKCGSRKEELVDDKTMDSLFGKLRFILRRQPSFLRPEKRDLIDNYLLLQNNTLATEIIGEATNPGFGRGGRREAVLFDEFAHVEAAIQSQAWTSLATVARSILSLSSPNGKGNQFHLNFIRAPAENKMQLDWTTNPTKTKEWFEGLLLENGGSLTWDQRAQEHECNFAGVGGVRVLRADRQKITITEDEIMLKHPFARERWPIAVAGDVGSGPSLTAFGFGLISWELGDGVDPLIILDDEVVRERQSAFDIGRDIKRTLSEYSGRRAIFGDPASKNKDSIQESWETNLQSSGVPYSALDPWYNDNFAIRETLEDVQRLLTKGLLLVHDRCLYAHEAIESWEWDIPKGVTVEMVSKEFIKPKKNVFSHSGDMIRYLVGFSLRGLRPGHIAPAKPPSTKEPVLSILEASQDNGETFYRVPGARGGMSTASKMREVSSAISGHKFSSFRRPRKNREL